MSRSTPPTGRRRDGRTGTPSPGGILEPAARRPASADLLGQQRRGIGCGHGVLGVLVRLVGHTGRVFGGLLAHDRTRISVTMNGNTPVTALPSRQNGLPSRTGSPSRSADITR